MGATIDWNQETRTAAAVKGEINVLPIGSIAPVRFVSEAFGGTFLAWDSPIQTIYIASAEINEPYDDIQKKIADKYVQDIIGLNHAGWLDKTSIGKELSETEQSDYISALIDIVDQHREIGSKMPVIYFDKDYFKTIILYQDAQGYAVKIVVISEDGPNGRKWAFDSIERK